MRFICLFLIFSSLVILACREKSSSPAYNDDEKKIRLQIIQTIKTMNLHYKRTTKKLEKATTAEKIVTIVDEHLSDINQANHEMLLLEISYPELFDKQEKSPPEESKTLRNSIEKFSSLMTKLSEKYKKSQGVLKSYQKIFADTKKRDQIVVRIYSDIIKAQQIEYANFVEIMKQWHIHSPPQNSLKKLKNFLSSVKTYKQKFERLNMKYPDIIQIQKKKQIQAMHTIQKLATDLCDHLKRLSLKKDDVINELILLLVGK